MRSYFTKTALENFRHSIAIRAKVRYHFWNLWVRPFSLLEFLVRRNPQKFQPRAPEFHPDLWADVGRSANCYAYAYGIRPDVFYVDNAWYLPQQLLVPSQSWYKIETQMRRDGSPGDENIPMVRAGQKLALLRTHLIADGLYPATLRNLLHDPEDRYLVSVLYAPHTNNVHFVRLDSDGKWSHKLGDFDVNRHDESGRIIKTPRRMASVCRYRFVGYYWLTLEKSPVIRKLKENAMVRCEFNNLPTPTFQPFPI